MKTWHGGCHCGALGFEFRTALAPSAWSIRACQCNFCRAHAGVYTSDPAGAVQFTHREPERVSRYRFGHKTADFIFCERCGGYLGAVTDVEGRTLMVINIHSLDPQPGGMPAAQPMSYEGESSGSRDSRRAVRWTPVKYA
jgi:hypothetical protein